jgi:hypothetical protein
MSSLDPMVRESLERLAPPEPDARPDWADVLRRAEAHQRPRPAAWLRLRSRRRATWIVALAALAVVAAGALAARSLLDRAEPGVANTVEPSAAKRLDSEPALAGAPWLTSRSGRIARIGQVAPRPSLVFPPGVTHLEALQRLYDAVSRRGELPAGARLGPPLAAGRVAVFPDDETTGIAIDLRAPFGYDPSSGVVYGPLLYGVSGALLPRPGAGTPLPVGATVEETTLADCLVLDPRRPSEPCPVVSASGPLSMPAAVLVGRPRTTAADTPGQMLLADLDRDGLRDVLAPSYWGQGVSVLMGGRRGLARARAVRVPLAGRYAGRIPAIAVAELTGDGVPDLVAVGNGPLTVLRGLGDGRFRPWARASLLPPRPDPFDRNAGVSVAPADLDGDGRAEIVVWNPSADRLWSFGADGQRLRRLGSASVPEDGFYRAEPFPGVGPGRVVAAGDMTGDGRDDVAVAVRDRVITLVAGPGGRLERASEVALPGGVAEVECADLNGDGRADLVMLGRSAAGVAVGRGDGRFHAPWVVAHDAGAVSSAGTGDVTGDGRADLLLPDGPASVLGLYPGNGDGTFGERLDIPAGNGPTDVVVADIDADGAQDLVVASDSYSTISLWAGTGRREPAP